MNWYRVSFKLRAWTASDWQADTIFGHLCWGMLYLYGEERLAAFLQEYREGRPPLLLSNGFPGELLPVPITTPPTLDITAPVEEQRAKYRKIKKQRAVDYIELDDFNLLLSGKRPEELVDPPLKQKNRNTLKNQLDRNTGTTSPNGRLFNFEENYQPEVTVYLKLTDEFRPVAEKLFGYLKDTGYGKRKSVGYGHIDSITMDKFGGFKTPQAANGFVTLSNFVPAEGDPVAGRWAVLVKYGRMGEAYAHEDHAFKKPLIMLKAGSTFRSATQREYYGRLVGGLNPHYPGTAHYAYALPVPMLVDE